MEWSVADGASRYRATLEEHEGRVSITILIRDGLEIAPPDVLVSTDDKAGRLLVEVDGRPRLVHAAKSGDSWWIHLDGYSHVVHFHEQGSSGPSTSAGSLTAPMPGTILEMLVKQGQRVREGQTLLVMEAMKMEHRIQAPKAGEVTKVHYEQGERVDMGSVLIEIGD
ncbi:MAG: biotin/lipoyl-containing protein [Candidatus Thalassarchaeaceae archaeon]|jgi:3-methylcrotonyl-CoA carboxylase alpha subunit|nr:biotin/lipoyl-containing protein [Candidatus Thalassarchaeaceae archaeon]